MEGKTFIFFCFTIFSVSILTSSAVDTITANQTISDSSGDKIVSANEYFALGFFSPGISQNRYLGIRYNKIGNETITWVANRNTPITDNSGVLKFDDYGNLVLVDGANRMIWSSNSSSKSVKNPVAQLSDQGNLVIRYENFSSPDNSNFSWQSFDYVENILLAGMRLGKNLVTGHEWALNSWKSDDDPSQGNYKIEVNTNGYPQLILREDSNINFRIGPWNGIRFSGIPTMGPNVIFTYKFILTDKEMYFTYDLISASVVTMLVVNPNGAFDRFTWIDETRKWQFFGTLQRDDCDRYALCGAYGSCRLNNGSASCQCLKGFVPKVAGNQSSGCVRKHELSCRGGDEFLKLPGMKVPDTQHSWFNLSMNLEECKQMCLKNCSCTAYANTYITGGGSGCLLWFNELIDVRELQESPQDLYIRVSASELEKERSSRMKRLLLILVPSIFVSILLLGGGLWYACKHKKQKKEANNRAAVEYNGPRENVREDVPLFDFTTIATATNYFSFNNKLGEGGFGPVYKGTLDSGQEIAVKRLSTRSRQGTDEFKNEVMCIAKLQHRNLVRLLGCSTQDNERMLIYEYMPNKSLDVFIFDKQQRKLLDWPMCYNIINGIARGLLYLHQDSRLRIIHRDLKASNILLDYEMNPKISDFGMARIFGGTETEANTSRVVGTYGYMSPEYAIDGLFSIKSDVYSFGVLVLEIISGKRNRGFNHPNHNLNLLGHAWELFKEDNVDVLIDGTTSNKSNHSQLLRALHIALLCVQQHPKDRPNMATVMMMMNGDIELPQPNEPGFFTDRKTQESDSSELVISNQLSVTVFAGGGR